MHKGCTKDECTTASADATPKLSQKEFYCKLTEGLINNNQDGVQTCSRRRVDSCHYLVLISPVQVLRATTKRKSGTDGKLTKFCVQGQCCVCIKARPITVCSVSKDKVEKALYFYNECSG